MAPAHVPDSAGSGASAPRAASARSAALRGSIAALLLLLLPLRAGEAARFTTGEVVLDAELVGQGGGLGARSLRYVSGKEGALLSEFPALCAAEIVKETCELLDKDDPDTVSQGEIRAALSGTRETTADLWSQMSLADEAAVGCEDFCKKLLDFLGSHKWVLPPKSDVGCYGDAGAGEKCDLDLSLKEIERSGSADQDLPDFHGDPQEEVNDTDSDSDTQESTVDYTVDELAMHVANLFRIYPKMPVEAKDLGAAAGGGGGAGGVLLEANGTEEDWRTHIMRISQVAEASVSKAIRLFQAQKSRSHMDWWFGKEAFSDEKSRESIRKVLNSISRLLGHVEYVYPGPKCEPRTYAYVYPGYKKLFKERKPYICDPQEIGKKKACTKTTEGKFVFYLCPKALSSDFKEQIETLTHEASHHATAYTKDVCWEDTWGPCQIKAYGRSTCHSLSPKKALKNADSYCYYISDVAFKPSAN